MKRLFTQLQKHWAIILGVLAVIVAIIIALLIINPPPKKIRVATGAEGGTYSEYGKRYQAFFAKRGITLQLVPTRGAQENADLVNDPNSAVDIAFVAEWAHRPAKARESKPWAVSATSPSGCSIVATMDGSLQSY
jgi:TRAP-type uncharacterized transport system substrate-binding protein